VTFAWSTPWELAEVKTRFVSSVFSSQCRTYSRVRGRAVIAWKLGSIKKLLLPRSEATTMASIAL
jgi:hypothetical protein